MTRPYDVSNWYWVINGNPTRAYSSADGDYVPVATDPGYLAFVADGNNPTRLAAETGLGEVLASARARPKPAAILAEYQQVQADDIFTHKLIKYLFVLHNDVRVLKGQQPHTIAQAKAYFRSLM